MLRASDIVLLFAYRGGRCYDGEPVTQLQHAWQCGQLARHAGAAPPLQLAAWLHDLGHLLSDLPGSPTLASVDDRHEAIGAAAIRPLFGDAVAEPVALHVQAKRWLFAKRPGYRDRLSADSRRSLALQGGPLAGSELDAFRSRAFADEALGLRVWDDASKVAGWRPPGEPQALAALGDLIAAVAADAGDAAARRR